MSIFLCRSLLLFTPSTLDLCFELSTVPQAHRPPRLGSSLGDPEGMALPFSLPSSSAGTIPPHSTCFRRPNSCTISGLPTPKLSRTFRSLLYSVQVPSVCHRCAAKARIFVSSPPPSSSPSSCTKVPTFPLPMAAGTTGRGYYSEDTGGLEDDDEGSPWEGAVVYRRDASVTHLEYCTTLERLGMGKLSSDLSRSRASAMGIRLITTRKGGATGDPCLAGTPVLVSIDVTRKKRRLRLDGIVRTVITLGCNRCAEPAAECVFSNFTLLLTEEPVEEPEEIDMGVFYGEDKARAFSMGEGQEGEDEQSIDLDDRVYFPAEEKEIDISKHIRDIVHVEITINAVCDATCKGLCLKCGTNLNKSRCNCHKGDVQQRKEHGPLGSLKKQMRQR